MSRDELRTKLTEVDEQHDELQRALREAEARQESLRQPQRNLMNLHFVLSSVDRAKLKQASPEDRRRLYLALQLQATVDRDGQVRLSGIFDPDVYLPSVVQDPPADPSTPRPKIPEGTRVVVTTPCARH